MRYVYIHNYLCIYVFIYVCVFYSHAYVHTYIHICMYVIFGKIKTSLLLFYGKWGLPIPYEVYIFIHVNIDEILSKFMIYILKYIYIYIYVCIYIYIYIYICICSFTLLMEIGGCLYHMRYEYKYVYAYMNVYACM
jgi:hypothetical protein